MKTQNHLNSIGGTSMRGLYLPLVALIMLCSFSVVRAKADTIHISDITDGVPAVTVIQDGHHININVLAAGPEFLKFWFTSTDPAGFTGALITDLIEPFGSDGIPGSVSDTFRLDVTLGSFINTVTVTSDPYTSCGCGTPIPENGLPQLVLTTFESNGSIADQWYFQSPSVPEPGSLVLLGSGLLGIAGVLRRKTRL